MNLDKQIAVITGASSGLGRLISEKLAHHGFYVILASRNEKKLNLNAQKIKKNGGHCIAIPTDITDESSIRNLAESVKKLGAISVLINNAGLGRFSEFSTHSTEIWDQQISVNLRGAFLVTRAFISDMKKSKKGRIVFINSTAGRQGYSHSAAYVASKYGLRGLAESLRMEVRNDGIKVISVYPGAFDSPFWNALDMGFPRGEMMTSDAVAEMVVQTILIPGNAVVEDLVLRRVMGDIE